ncbi:MULTISPECIES: lipoprotein insertase outer membrane protein LolB [unclassified Acinetobacter]|uniref:lipoprotein insertase outer membrane protein LolB n=1 Tax=unclassified Acinetobacter TaxID=196816 RepID=UPI0035B9583F
MPKINAVTPPTSVNDSSNINANTTTPSTTPTTTPPEVQQFQISGKIGVRTPQQTGSAFYAWNQLGEQFAIEITGALGIGQTSIQGQTGQVSLTNSKTGTIYADTPEELLQKATGWQAPISQLRWWIDGKTATADAVKTLDTQGRLQQVKEFGWTADFSYDGEQKLPNRLIIIDDAQQNRIILTIQTRQ